MSNQFTLGYKNMAAGLGTVREQVKLVLLGDSGVGKTSIVT
jgi:GTPase SAR1 family protein